MLTEAARARWLAAGVFVVVLVVDQWTKQLALIHLSETERIPLLGDALGLQLAFNAGASFSLGAGFTPVITAIGLGALVAFAVMASRVRRPSTAIALGLVSGGAAGNIADRLFADPGPFRGRVTDFLAWGDVAIGNLADVFIAAAVGVWLIARLRETRTRQHDEPAADAAGR